MGRVVRGMATEDLGASLAMAVYVFDPIGHGEADGDVVEGCGGGLRWC